MNTFRVDICPVREGLAQKGLNWMLVFRAEGSELQETTFQFVFPEPYTRDLQFWRDLCLPETPASTDALSELDAGHGYVSIRAKSFPYAANRELEFEYVISNPSIGNMTTEITAHFAAKLWQAPLQKAIDEAVVRIAAGELTSFA